MCVSRVFFANPIYLIFKKISTFSETIWHIWNFFCSTSHCFPCVGYCFIFFSKTSICMPTLHFYGNTIKIHCVVCFDE